MKYNLFIFLFFLVFNTNSFATVYDDFDENEIDPNKWKILEASPGSYSIGNGQLQFITNQQRQSLRLQSNVSLRGDFEVVIEYSSYLASTGSSLGEPPSWPHFQLYIANSISNIYAGERAFLGISTNPNSSSNIGAGWEPDDPGDSSRYVGTTDREGALKVVKTGDTLKFYYSSSGTTSWSFLHQLNGRIVSPAVLYLHIESGNNTGNFETIIDRISIVGETSPIESANFMENVEFFRYYFENDSKPYGLCFRISDDKKNQVWSDLVKSISWIPLSQSPMEIVDYAYRGTNFITIAGDYDTTSQEIIWQDSPYLNFYDEYEFFIGENIIEDIYRLEIQTKDEQLLTRHFEIGPYPDNYPPIRSSSFSLRMENGDLVWSWELPGGGYSLEGTEINARIRVYKNGSFTNTRVRIFNLPTTTNSIIIPKSIVDQIKLLGDQFGFRVRAAVWDHDQKLGLYSFSNWDYYEFKADSIVPATLFRCDVQNDGKIGLEEAIQALQVVSGLR